MYLVIYPEEDRLARSEYAAFRAVGVAAEDLRDLNFSRTPALLELLLTSLFFLTLLLFFRFLLLGSDHGLLGSVLVDPSLSCHECEIIHMDIDWDTVLPDLSVVDPDRPVADILYLVKGMGYDDDGRPFCLYLLELVETLSLEVGISDCEYLVDQENIRVDIDSD